MDELIASSPILAAFAAIPQPFLWMILIGALLAMIDVRWTALALILLSTVALLRSVPAQAYEYGVRPGTPYAYAKKHYPRGRNVGQLGGYNPFASSYEHRAARMAREYDEPHVMYNGGYYDSRSRFRSW